MVRISSNRSSRRKTAVIIICLVVLAVAVGLLLLKQHNDAEKAKHTTVIPSHKSPVSPSPATSDKSSSNQGNVPPSNPSDKSTASSSTTLQTPSSDGLVSNHQPSSASPGEQSVCNASPGASCYITFTKDGETKKLDAQTTDVNGFAYWTWDINTAGLTAGTWTITVTATLNGQTKSAQDAIDLVVQS